MSKFSLFSALCIGVLIGLGVRTKRGAVSDTTQGFPDSCLLLVEWDAKWHRLNCGVVATSISHRIANVSLRDKNKNILISNHNLKLSIDDNGRKSAGFYIEIGEDVLPSPFPGVGESMFSIKHDGDFCIEVFPSAGGSDKNAIRTFNFHCSYTGSDDPRLTFEMR